MIAGNLEVLTKGRAALGTVPLQIGARSYILRFGTVPGLPPFLLEDFNSE